MLQGSPGNISQFEDILFASTSDAGHSFGVAALNVANSDNTVVSYLLRSRLTALATYCARDLLWNKVSKTD